MSAPPDTALLEVKDLSVDQGITVLSDPEALVVSVKIVAAEISAEEVAAEAEPQAEGPEVIGKPEQQESEKPEE